MSRKKRTDMDEWLENRKQFTSDEWIRQFPGTLPGQYMSPKHYRGKNWYWEWAEDNTGKQITIYKRKSGRGRPIGSKNTKTIKKWIKTDNMKDQAIMDTLLEIAERLKNIEKAVGIKPKPTERKVKEIDNWLDLFAKDLGTSKNVAVGFLNKLKEEGVVQTSEAVRQMGVSIGGMIYVFSKYKDKVEDYIKRKLKITAFEIRGE